MTFKYRLLLNGGDYIGRLYCIYIVCAWCFKIAILDTNDNDFISIAVCLYTYEFWLSLCKIVWSSVILLLPLFAMYAFMDQVVIWVIVITFCLSFFNLSVNFYFFYFNHLKTTGRIETRFGRNVPCLKNPRWRNLTCFRSRWRNILFLAHVAKSTWHPSSLAVEWTFQLYLLL